MAAAKKKLTQAQVIVQIAEATEMSKKDVKLIFETLSELAGKQLVGRGSPGEMLIPGLVKLKTVKKPATKERQGVNPFTKEPMTIAAKPASKKVKVSVLKTLKDMVL